MIPYVLLIGIPLIFSFCALDRAYSPARIRVATQYDPLVYNKNLALPIFFAMYFLLLALRHESIGRDLLVYKTHFETFIKQPFAEFNLFRTESLYRLLNWCIGRITDNYQVFLAVVAMLTVFPIAKMYCQERRHSFMQIMIFVSMSTFIMSFSGLKQALATSCGIIAYGFVKQKKPFWFLLIAIIAIGIHHSAFMILFMYPLYYMRLKKNHLWFVVPILVVIFVFNRLIFQSMTMLLSFFGEEYELTAGSTGAYTMLILFVAFSVFSYVVTDESQMDDELFGLRNFLLLTVVLQCFAPIHPLAMRMNYYYIIFIPMTIAKLVEIPKPNMKRIAKLASVLITIYFTYDFLSKTYQSYVTGISALDTIPYKFFWMN